MDLADFDSVTRAEDGVEFELKNPRTGIPMGFFLTIKGADSKAYKQAMKEAMQKVSPKTTPNDIKEAVLVATVIGWRAEVDGSPAPVLFRGVEKKFSEAALKEVFASCPDFRDQALMFQENRANFLPRASAS